MELRIDNLVRRPPPDRLPPLSAVPRAEVAPRGLPSGGPAPRIAPATMSLEDLLVLVFSGMLEREARGIAEAARRHAEAAVRFAETGDFSAVEAQELAEMRLDLRQRMKDREHLFSMLLAILKSLDETAKKALESLGR